MGLVGVLLCYCGSVVLYVEIVGFGFGVYFGSVLIMLVCRLFWRYRDFVVGFKFVFFRIVMFLDCELWWVSIVFFG